LKARPRDNVLKLQKDVSALVKKLKRQESEKKAKYRLRAKVKKFIKG